MKNKSLFLLLVLVMLSGMVKAIRFKDSTTALFLRLELKQSGGLFYYGERDSTNSYRGYKEPGPYGLILGCRYSSTFKKVKNNLLSYLFTGDLHFDKQHAEITFDSFRNSTDSQYLHNSRGFISENVEIHQLTFMFQAGLKYNFRGIRPALGYWIGTNIYSRTKGAGPIAEKTSLFKMNQRHSFVTYIQHGLKLDVYVPLTKKMGAIAGVSAAFPTKIPKTKEYFESNGFYWHIGFDYKISKQKFN